MVKKIKLIEDPTASADELDTAEYQRKMLEYQQAIDWKLWELLKIAQSIAEKNDIATKSNTKESSDEAYPFDSIVVVEDDE